MLFTMVRGSCLCGGVRFEADEIPIMTSCHCSMCRKAGGGAFGCFAHARPVRIATLSEGTFREESTG